MDEGEAMIFTPDAQDRYQFHPPIYHSISSFDDALDMACAAFDKSTEFIPRLLENKRLQKLQLKYSTWEQIKHRPRIIR